MEPLNFEQIPCQRGEIQGLFLFMNVKGLSEMIVGEIIAKSLHRQKGPHRERAICHLRSLKHRCLTKVHG